MTVEQNLDSIAYFITKGMARKEFPGGQIIIVKDNRVILDSCFGFTSYDKHQAVTPNTLYDLASVTKPMATTLMAMELYERGDFDPKQTISHYLPKYDSTDIGDIPITRFLTHSSGLVSSLALQYNLIYADGKSAALNNWFKGVLHNRRGAGYSTLFSKSSRENLYVYNNIKYKKDYIDKAFSGRYSIKLSDSLYLSPSFYSKVLDSAVNSSKRYDTGRNVYSDINFYLLREVLEGISHTRIDSFLYKNVYHPLMLNRIGYEPLERGVDPLMIAPTEYDHLLRKKLLVGEVHDEFAAIMGGVEGNAGLFSNARDLLPLCRELMDSTNGFFSADTKKLFLSQPYLEEENFRAMGFARQDSTQFLRSTSFGHTGYAGTFFQIDPSKGLILIFLSNSVHPSRSNLAPIKERTYYQIWRVLNDSHIFNDQLKQNN